MSKLIFTLSPGSTSTKFALYDGEECLLSKNLAHQPQELANFAEINDQLPYRKQMILDEIKKAGYSLEGVVAFSALSGSMVSMEGGTYNVNDIMLKHAREGHTIVHPAMLGSQLVYSFAQEFGGKAYIVDPPDVDELCDLARVTGLKEITRESRVHALNQKETARRYASEIGKRYDEANIIVVHMGGGISIVSHQRGKMVDGNDCANGEGPMSANRPGALPAMQLMKLCYSGKYTEKEMHTLLSKRGGLLNHLEQDDLRDIKKSISEGDKYAELIYEAMIYQACKQIGACAVVLRGKVDGIVLTGGMANDQYLVDSIIDRTVWIAPVKVYAGDFEMDALANGVLRVLNGEEEPKNYTGIPVFQGFGK